MNDTTDTAARKGDQDAPPGRQLSCPKLTCPTCGAPAAAPAAPGGKTPRPFCSRRCADVDLGRWFQGRYAIPAVDAADDSIIETLAAADLSDQDAP